MRGVQAGLLKEGKLSLAEALRVLFPCGVEAGVLTAGQSAEQERAVLKTQVPPEDGLGLVIAVQIGTDQYRNGI